MERILLVSLLLVKIIIRIQKQFEYEMMEKFLYSIIILLPFGKEEEKL